MDPKLRKILDIVIEHYLVKGEPVGSKFLNTLEEVSFAPSTLRKYLNILEKEGMVFQPYNSAGRIPTVVGLESYLEHLILSEHELSVDIEFVRENLKNVVEIMGELADGVVVGFIKQDQYYYLGINNLLKEHHIHDYETIREIVKFIEHKKIIDVIQKKPIKMSKINYLLMHEESIEGAISIVYTAVELGSYHAVMAIVGPARLNYKVNVGLLKRFISSQG